MALGVKDIGKAQEFGRSTYERDRDAAGEVYRKELVAWDAKMDAWQTLLKEGPKSLSHKQQVALAADHAKAFLAQHEEEPLEAPPASSAPEPTNDAAWLAMVNRMSLVEHEAFVVDLKECLRERGDSQERLIFQLFRFFDKYPAFWPILAADLVASLEATHGEDTDAALAARGLYVDAETRQRINLQMNSFMGAARRGLEMRRAGDYSPVKELEAAPAFASSGPSPTPAANEGELSLEFLLDHKAKTTGIRPKTVADNRAYLKKFAKFIKHDDARKVTKEDVRRWRDSLMEKGLSSKTVTDKYLSALRAVLSHGVKEFDLPFNAASGIADNRPPQAPERSKGWTEEEAIQILKTTFGGSSKAVSKPHRRALFWIPWILAYTGLRAVEVAQLQGQRLMEKGGTHYLLITPADGSTKSGKAWAVGIHKHLIELGLLDFIRGIGDGPLFYEPYPKGTDLTKLKGKHRALEASGRVAKWIVDEVGLKAPLGRPLHAFRHLFTTRSRACEMNKEARDFMMGSRSETDAREGYGDWPPAVLDAEINKLPRFAVASRLAVERQQVVLGQAEYTDGCFGF